MIHLDHTHLYETLKRIGADLTVVLPAECPETVRLAASLPDHFDLKTIGLAYDVGHPEPDIRFRVRQAAEKALLDEVVKAFANPRTRTSFGKTKVEWR